MIDMCRDVRQKSRKCKSYDGTGQEKRKMEEELKRLEHKKHRVENQMEYLSKKKFNNQKSRNHRFIHKGIAIECIDKNTELLIETEFYELAEEIFSNSKVEERVASMESVK